MSRTIIIPLSNPQEDRERIAEQALQASSFLDDGEGAAIVLVSAIEDESLRVARKEYVVEVAKSINQDVATVVDVGDPADVILNSVVGATNPIVIMASHGKHGVPLRMLGSTTAAVARRADCPTLILPVSATRYDPPARIERVLLPMEDPLIADALAAAAIEEIGVDRAKDAAWFLVEVAVSRSPQPIAVSEYRGSQGAHELPTHFLRHVAARLSDDGYRATWDLRIGEPARELATYAGQEQIDLIVMPARSRTGPNSLMPRILAELARLPVPIPVLLVQLDEMPA